LSSKGEYAGKRFTADEHFFSYLEKKGSDVFYNTLFMLSKIHINPKIRNERAYNNFITPECFREQLQSRREWTYGILGAFDIVNAGDPDSYSNVMKNAIAAAGDVPFSVAILTSSDQMHNYASNLHYADKRVNTVVSIHHDEDALAEIKKAFDFCSTEITPWEIKGDIASEKLIKEFGIQPLENSEIYNDSTFRDIFYHNILFRRNIIFAHRGFEKILKVVKDKKPFVMMTGMMPTGKFHIGHMILARQIIFYQHLGAKIYLCVADIEAYHTRGQSLEESRKIAIEEYILNYIALGLKPENCEIYFQSNRSEYSEKSNAYYRLQNILARHATFNEFKAVYGEITPGKMISAVLQASDMLHPQLREFEGPVPVIVPVGIDQEPHIRLARDMCSRINGYNNFKFQELCSTYHTFIPGLTGGKMSSSNSTSYIALTDTPEDAAKKVKKYAFSGGGDTIDEHKKHGGKPDIDVSFQWLRIFEEDDLLLENIRNQYTRGNILSGELKNLLISKLTPFLTEHQANREKARKVLHKYINIKGS